MRERFKSILSRIVWLHILALVIAAIAMPLASYFLLNTTANEYEYRILKAHAETISGYLKLDADGQWQLSLPPDLKTFYSHSFDGFAYSVVNAANLPLFSSLPKGGRVLERAKRASSAKYFKRKARTAIYFGASFPVTRSGQTVWIQVAQDVEHPDVVIDNIVLRYLWRVAWFTIPIMLLLLMTDIYIFRRALYPVTRASAMARAIDPNRIDVRLPTEKVPSEILPLVVTVNQALDRLEEGFRVQKEFTADAAHELRTPLAVLRMRIDMLPDQVSAAVLRSDLEMMTSIVNQLLEVAELENSTAQLDDTVDLYAVCTDVVSGLAPMAIAQNKDMALTGSASPVFVKGNSTMLYQAVRNLAENALNHTPSGTTVEINLTEGGAVNIMDEGPGVPADEMETIFKRFWRGDHKRSIGAGLGLAIVARIVDAHKGKIEVQNRPAGGASFSISLATV